MPTTLRRTRRPRRGTTLLEALVAATVLAVGVLGAVGVLATAARDASRARARHAAVALLAARVERWRAAPCATSSGQQQAGPLVERWRATGNGTLATLADTVTYAASSPRGGDAGRTGITAVAWCSP